MLHVVFVVSTVVVMLDEGKDFPSMDERHPIEGVWVLESFTNEGVTKSGSEPNTAFQWQRIKIDEGSLLEWYSRSDTPDMTKIVFRFRLHPMHDTRQFEFGQFTGLPGEWTKKGIYKIKGDQLTMCFRVELINGPRVKIPQEFSAEVGSRTGLAVYKRLKSKE